LLAMSQGELFTDSSEDLPPQARFPINGYGRHVEEPVKQELSASRDPLIITGYTSLTIRILLGHEPIASPQYEFRSSRHHFSQEVNDYWLERGISITLCAKVLAAIEVIDKGIVQTRISSDVNRQPIHAKIYQADQAITLGSSNFS